MATSWSGCSRRGAAALVIAGAGCGSLQKGAKKVVSIEYDQARNFDAYRFGDALNLESDTGTLTRITTTGLDRREVWMLDEICGVANTGSKAQDFELDVGKFYVRYGGVKHHAAPLISRPSSPATSTPRRAAS